MISDFVKGKKQFDYPLEVQKGIQLHRAIDAFTDKHPSTIKIKSFFRSDYRLYAGAFTDIVYDYFLANDKKEFENQGQLEGFALQTFELLNQNTQWLSGPFLLMLPNMQQQNWLYNYRFDWGIRKSFEGLKRRAKYIDDINNAFEIFLQHKPEFEEHYAVFFPQVKSMAWDFLHSVK